MPGTLIKLTAAGRAALVGPDNTGTVSRQVVSIGIANASFVHSDDLTALPDEYKRINTIAGKNVAPDTIHVTIRDDSTDQFTAYGFGLYLDNGILLGTYSQDTPILEKSPAAILLLSADMQFVSIDAALLTFGDASFANPPASTETLGVIELATQAETDAGVDMQRAVTPKTLASRLALLAPLTSAALLGAPTAPTPTPGDNSQRLATTAFVQSIARDALVGQIVIEPRKTARAGCLKLNGALFNRADYPLLWAYAQASGALVSEAEWNAGARGCFSSGDGATTFRIPEVRGEFLRCWDDGRGVDTARGIGTYQGFQNALHTHTASLSAAGDHTHSTWTDAQGWHGHHGNTGGGGGHNHGILGGDTQISMSGPSTVDGHSRQSIRQYTEWAGDHGHAFDTDGAGTHGHNIGMNGSGNHTHAITIAADGGNEARPRNIAMLAMIRAY